MTMVKQELMPFEEFRSKMHEEVVAILCSVFDKPFCGFSMIGHVVPTG